MFNVKFSKSKNFKEEYCCTPIIIGELFPIKNSDYLALTQANGFPIIVRKDQVCTGDTMFYVSNESQIKSEFLAKNNLFAKSSFNKDKNVKGYFDNNGRVRILKLRGEYSLGYLFSIAELQKVYPKLEITDIRIGESFDTINGELFVKAYCPPIKINSVRRPHEKSVKKFSCIIPEYFHFHYDTSPLNQNINRINPDDIVTIDLKIHGSSCIISNTKVNIPRFKSKFYLKILPYLPKWLQFTKQEYRVVYSSRTVIKNSDLNLSVSEGYYSKDIWGDYYSLLKDYIPKGISIYGEIFGFVTGTNTYIQSRYDYGCKAGTNKLMIYRINQDEREWEILDVYNWTINLIKEHPELEPYIHPIDILYHGTLRERYPNININQHWHENVLKALATDIEFKMEEQEPLCKNKVYREGIVLRIDNDPIKEAFKLKCLNFLNAESRLIDKGIVDIELTQSNY